MSGELKPIANPTAEQLYLIHIATELQAVASSIAEAARMLATVEGARRAGFEAAIAAECRELGGALHDSARYYELKSREDRPALSEAPTHRDLTKANRRDIMSTIRIVFGAIGAGCGAAAAAVGLATAWPKLALALLAIGLGCAGLATNLPTSGKTK